MGIAIHGEVFSSAPSWLIPLRLFQTRFFSVRWNENFVRSADAIPLSDSKLLDYPTPLINLREGNAPSPSPSVLRWNDVQQPSTKPFRRACLIEKVADKPDESTINSTRSFLHSYPQHSLAITLFDLILETIIFETYVVFVGFVSVKKWRKNNEFGSFFWKIIRWFERV